jgi:coenzyme PQQ precursor peptide PqqA
MRSGGSCFAHWVRLRPPRSFMPSLRQFGGHDFKTASAQCLLAPLLSQSYRCRARSPVGPRERRSKMTWKTPKIVEVPVGMEINMYACAARK